MLAYLALRSVCLLLMLLPLRLAYFLARCIGWAAFHIFRFRRQVVMDNLAIAFGTEMEQNRLAALAARAYRHIAMTFIELLIAPKLRSQVHHVLEPDHVELMQGLLRQGKGLVTVSGHLGNWELQGAAAATAIKDVLTVAAVQQSNPYIDRFITRRRNAMGMQVAGSKEAMRLLLRALKSKQAIGLVADQNAGRDAVFVDFFGKIAATHPGPAQLALKFGAPLLVCVLVRTGPAQFKMLARQVEIKDEDTVETLTRRHVKILEAFIREYPEQYYWLHKRWKTRPPGELLKTRGKRVNIET